MKPSQPARERPNRCDVCGEITPGYDSVNYGSPELGYRLLCNHCLNAEVAREDGLEGFEDPRFEPVRLADCAGKVREFHFRTRLFGPGVALDAFELRDGYPAGYQFQIIGDPSDDLMVLLGRLIEKMRRALSTQHIVDREFGLGITDSGVVRGRIECDLCCDPRLPLLVVDGREIAWDDFGRMLMTYEGWQFKLEIRDQSEEL
ncbi:MAG: hypothetical protein HY822_17750 [Acidobacteria bacterium]|nr:hypothetical protein [Acidobacteriota bacterium]